MANLEEINLLSAAFSDFNLIIKKSLSKIKKLHKGFL